MSSICSTRCSEEFLQALANVLQVRTTGFTQKPVRVNATVIAETEGDDLVLSKKIDTGFMGDPEASPRLTSSCICFRRIEHGRDYSQYSPGDNDDIAATDAKFSPGGFSDVSQYIRISDNDLLSARNWKIIATRLDLIWRPILVNEFHCTIHAAKVILNQICLDC